MEKLNINAVMARAFINTIQYALIVDNSEIDDRMTVMRFKMLTDAQLSVLYSIGQLVTSKAEVFTEYDRMFNLLREHTPDNTVSLAAMAEGREALKKLLDQSINH